MNQAFTAERPMLIATGNHGIFSNLVLFCFMFSEAMETFLPFLSRFRMPDYPLYFSVDVGGAHLVAISSYVSNAPKSEQFLWLKEDLEYVKT